MTKEEKQLLLIDLCARLPYKTTVECSIESKESCQMDIVLQPSHIEEFIEDSLIIKPYLRPMSSLIGKELDECRETCKYRQVGQSVLDCATPQTIDYLISHHFDYRGLIEKGLALEAPEGMYKTE